MNMELPTELLEQLFACCRDPQVLIAAYGTNRRFRDIVKRLFEKKASNKSALVTPKEWCLSPLTVQKVCSIGLIQQFVIYSGPDQIPAPYLPSVIYPYPSDIFEKKERLCTAIKTYPRLNVLGINLLYDRTKDRITKVAAVGHESQNVAVNQIKIWSDYQVINNNTGKFEKPIILVSYWFFINPSGKMFVCTNDVYSPPVYRINVSSKVVVRAFSDEICKKCIEKNERAIYVFMQGNDVIDCFEMGNKPAPFLSIQPIATSAVICFTKQENFIETIIE